MTPTCAICGKPVAPRPANGDFPFCSSRCRLLDLGNWLSERYRVPGGRAGDGAPRLDDPDPGEALARPGPDGNEE